MQIKKNQNYLIVKNILDRIFAFLLIIFLSPLLILISILLLNDSKGVIFFQKRCGLKMKIFNIYKFKTMTDKKLNLECDIQRLTRLGKFLRSTSLDELPSLFNILIGDMSFVGPRPFISDYLEHYTKEENLRHTIKPGLTGWAQINGRNNTTWEKRLIQDLWYVKNQCFLLDIKILFKTFWKVISRNGINESKRSTMPRLDNLRDEKKYK